jgi:hypothetical protein
MSVPGIDYHWLGIDVSKDRLDVYTPNPISVHSLRQR